MGARCVPLLLFQNLLVSFDSGIVVFWLRVDDTERTLGAALLLSGRYLFPDGLIIRLHDWRTIVVDLDEPLFLLLLSKLGLLEAGLFLLARVRGEIPVVLQLRADVRVHVRH